MSDDEEWVKCDYCGKEIPEDEAIYIEGRPYCEDCENEGYKYADF